MALIERVKINNNSENFGLIKPSEEIGFPGLTIRVRVTTASRSDYTNFDLDEGLTSQLDRIITYCGSH